MLKQIGVRLEEELVKQVKQQALDTGTTVQEIVKLALENYLDNNLTIAPAPKPQPKKKQDFYILRSTATRKKVEEATSFTDGYVTWELMKGFYAHYDADGNVIPFRCTNWDGNTFEPFPNEIEELEEAYGKPVKREEEL